ncbi:sigma-70 family RNA polymerase sigma factor [Arthrobacter sp. HS15c]|uniref:sigma-70 family RNA polymerase sigma factor n=1 Tax=Arthrobacter sp. HS15c TaxID=3230279 RepID=UPI003466D8A4
MPDFLPALALDQPPALDQPTAPPQEERSPQGPASRGGQLRETFEQDLVLEFLDLAEALAARFDARGRERADLNQVAYLGLVKAARGFDQAKGDSFPAYAAPTINGELKRYLRDRSWMVRPPRHIQDLRTRLYRVEPELAQALGRTPSIAELAQELETDPADVLEAICASSSMHPDSLDAVNPNGDSLPVAEMLATPDSPIERLEELACLREAMHDLAPADRELLYRRYFCEETQVQLGERLGMSQMQVSRRLARVLVALQRRLQEGNYADSSPAAAASTSSAEIARRAGSGRSEKGSPRRSSARVRTT